MTTAAPKWPALPQDEIKPIATACNLERQELTRERAREDVHGRYLQSLRASFRSARLAAHMLQGDLADIVEEVTKWGDEVPRWQRTDTLAALHATIQAIDKLKPFLLPSRQPGGQAQRWQALAMRIACHLRDVLQGIGGPPPSNAALTRFLRPLLGAVYQRDFTDDAIVQAFKRFQQRRAVAGKAKETGRKKSARALSLQDMPATAVNVFVEPGSGSS